LKISKQQIITELDGTSLLPITKLSVVGNTTSRDKSNKEWFCGWQMWRNEHWIHQLPTPFKQESSKHFW